MMGEVDNPSRGEKRGRIWGSCNAGMCPLLLTNELLSLVRSYALSIHLHAGRTCPMSQVPGTLSANVHRRREPRWREGAMPGVKVA